VSKTEVLIMNKLDLLVFVLGVIRTGFTMLRYFQCRQPKDTDK